MAAGEGVVFAFLGAGEGADAVQFAVGVEAFAPPRQYLVAVGLVTHVPDDAVGRRVEHIVQGHRQLDDAQRRREVPGIDAHLLYDVLPQLVAKLRQLLYRQLPQVGRVLYLVE